MSKEGSNSGWSNHGPSQCEHRSRAEDAAESAREMAQLMKGMDGAVAWHMIRAREAAINIREAFPEGDQRFANVEDDDDDVEEGPFAAEEEGLNDADADDDADAGFEADVNEEEAYDDEGDDCIGLLDDGVDAGPLSSLRRMKGTYDFDLVAELDNANLNLLQRIRLVNWTRKRIRERNLSPEDAIVTIRGILARRDSTVLENDALLEPVVPGDVLLTVLEGVDDEDADGRVSAKDDDDDQENKVCDAVIRSLRSEGMI